MPKKQVSPKRSRCWWCGEDPLYVAYHDEEWGVPVHDDRRLFEFLTLETFQAGLSWITILRKRENFRKAFSRFDPEKVARYGAREKARLLKDEGIVRNRAKIAAAVTNARSFLAIQEEFGTFDKYIWEFTGFRTLRREKSPKRGSIPSTSKEAELLSKDLKQRGFAFVGPTVVYAHMQATGMVDDHVEECFRFKKR